MDALVRRGVPARSIVIETRDAAHAMIRGEGYARLVVIVFDAIPTTRTAGSAGCS
jgi:hypothetical protein